MTISWLSHACQKLKRTPFSYLLTQAISDPLALVSPANPRLSESFHKLPLHHKICGPQLLGRPYNPFVVDLQIDHCGLNLYNAKICTSSGANNGGKQHDVNKGSNIQHSWIDLYLPDSVRPYAQLARLDKPIGTWLLAWPCLWSITLATPSGNLPDVKMLLLFGCGSLLLRGAGCTVNDLLDRDIDPKEGKLHLGWGRRRNLVVYVDGAEFLLFLRGCPAHATFRCPCEAKTLCIPESSVWQVDRTKHRPIASGLITPFQGLSFLGAQLLLGLGILLQLNNYSRVLGASSLLLVFSYPLMKRVTFWPQAYLGLTFNWGALLGWAAVRGSLDPAIVLPLYCSGVFWTLVYDTIYAHQDKEDDLKVGVKSTALRFGDLTKNWVTGFGIACISSLTLSGYNAGIGWPFYPFLLAASGQLAWQIWTVDLSSRADCDRNDVVLVSSITRQLASVQTPDQLFMGSQGYRERD
ncbi:hypothetical protein IFM89_000305 [Coptis chinensis]|uniref:4-hydroxybenzoate polyprenyltransferase, mitochondrial n=1 Tax=Coptis chinensis TaxID=261450 RepID=A0A835LK31_9MAGN|nr:hypothetical protein IFM89_000305 [Coptis chinensis]